MTEAPVRLPGVDVSAFGFDLLGELLARCPGENLVVGPYCLAQALTLAAMRAKPEARAAIRETLRCQWFSDDAVEAWHASVRERLGGCDAVRQAAACWVDQACPSEPDVAKRQVRLGAQDQYLDFRQPQACADAVNDWVSAATKGLIPQIATPGNFASRDRAVLTSATFLKGKWLAPFGEDATRPRWFRFGGLRGAFVPTMWQRITMYIHQQPELSAIRLSYGCQGDERLVFEIALPHRLVSLETTLIALRAAHAEDRLFATNELVQIDLRLPRFQIELGQRDAALVDALAGMGLAPALRQITAIGHRAKARVDERGTVAAAASLVGMTLIAPVHQRPNIIRFHANRPFVWSILEVTTGAMLFAGIVANPM